MATATMQKVLQEVAILALGRGATAAELAALENMAGPNGDYAPLVEFVNQYMSNLAATQGTANVVKAIALNGLGMSLSTSEANALAAAVEAGSLSWADGFLACINKTDSHGQTLNNRAEAAHGFLADLAAASKSSYFSGAAVELAVKNLLQGIGSSASSLSNGQSGLDALVANLKSTGIQGAVVDGYVKNATVFVDANGDGVQNAGEWSTTTDANGNYVLPANTAGGKIIASGGTDIMTGKPFQGVLTAPAGSTVVNPLTTLVQGMIESGQAASVEAATNAVQQALGLPTDVNPLTYDPLAVLADTNASAAAKSAALSVQATALQVANVISQAGAAIDAGSSAATLLSSANAVIEALVGAMAGGASVNLGSATTLAAIVQTAATSAGATSVANMATDLAAITAASNTAAAGATTITQLAQTAVVAQDSAVAAITSGVTGGSLASATSSFTGSALNTLVNQATVGEIAPGVVVPPPTTTTPPAGGGGGGGTPVTTFTVTNTAGVVTFGGTATGNITVTIDGDNTVFTRGGIAQTVATEDIDSIEPIPGQPLVMSAVVADGLVIDSGCMVQITALEDTPDADLSNIASSASVTVHVTTTDGTPVTLTASFNGHLVVIDGDGILNVDGVVNWADYEVGAEAVLEGTQDQISWREITGNGDVIVKDLGSATDLTNIEATIDLTATVTSSVNLSGVDLNGVDALEVDDGNDTNVITATVTPDQLAALDGIYTLGADDQIITDAVNPGLDRSNPADGAGDVAIDVDLHLTFDEAINLGAGSIVLKKTADDSVVETFDVATGEGDNGGTVAVSSIINSKIVVNPGDNLLNSTGYYLTIDATAVTDPSGNAFAGIADKTTLNFTTTDIATTISAIEISADTGSDDTDFITNTAAQTITATLSAELAASEVLMGSVDNGVNWIDITDKVSGTAVSWDGATLAGTSTIKLQVEDAGGNAGTAASQNYELDDRAPTLASATVDDSTLVLTFTDANDLDLSTPPATDDFTVSVGGTPQEAPTAIDVNEANGTITLTLAAPVLNGDVVTVAYTDGAGDILDIAGNLLESLSDAEVTNNTAGETTPPVFASAAVDGDALVLTYTDDSNLDDAKVPANTDFAVTVAGAGRNVAAVAVDAAKKTVTLTLASAVAAGEEVTVAYTQPGDDANRIQDEFGNDAITLADQTVTNNTADTTAPTSTITAADYFERNDNIGAGITNTIKLTGTDFNTLLESGETAATDIKARLDWTKFVWDIDNDDGATADVTFAAGDIDSVYVANDTTLYVKLTDAKAAALYGNANFNTAGSALADGVDIAASFLKDTAGNAATTDAHSGAFVSNQYEANLGDADVLNSAVHATDLVLKGTGTITIDGSNFTASPTNIQIQDGDGGPLVSVALSDLMALMQGMLTNGSSGVMAADLTGATDVMVTLGANGDTLTVTTGPNSILTGAGNDVLILADASPAVPQETDLFSEGADKIQISLSAFTAITSAIGTLGAAEFISVSGGLCTDTTQRIAYDSDTGDLWYDADGSGAGEAVKLVSLIAVPALANTNIEVIA